MPKQEGPETSVEYRLDRCWDEIVKGLPTSSVDVNPALVATIERVHALDAAPGADPVFAGRLWQDLVQTAVRGSVALPQPFGPTLNGRPAVPDRTRAWATVAPSPTRRLRPRRLVATAAVLAAAIVLGIVVPSFLSTVRHSSSALAVIEEAQAHFAAVPAFRATIVYDLNPEGAISDVPQGATATIEVSYEPPLRYRQEIVDERPPLAGTGGPGSFFVWGGRQIADYRAGEQTLYRFAMPADVEPLREFSWNSPYPNWEDICRRGGSRVLPDERIAGRTARHVRCGDWTGGFWELWIDAETGLVLKVVGTLGRDDFRLGTSPRGGFEVTAIEYGPTFAPDTFVVAAPPGARDPAGEREAAQAAVPSFRATYTRRVRAEAIGAESGSISGDSVSVETVSYRDEDTWRWEVVSNTLPMVVVGGAGSFRVWDGRQQASYFTPDNVYELQSDRPNPPVRDLVPALRSWSPGEREAPTQSWEEYSRAHCTTVAAESLLGRPVTHLRCTTSEGSEELWIDVETGIILKWISPHTEIEVTAFEVDPVFPPETFTFVPPAGARDVAELWEDPYTHVTIAAGDLAPPWTGRLLGGGTLDLQALRGQPVLVLFWADWCGLGDPACDVLPQLQQVAEQRAGQVAVVAVDVVGSEEAAAPMVGELGLTVPVVVDSSGAASRVWGVESVPVWVLLDAEGRVVEVRIGPQSVEELEELLSRALE